MNYLDYLFSFQRFGIKLGLDNINHLLRHLGNPEQKFPAIHVAGTNGKGSVVAFIYSALMEMGYSVGQFISPHLVDFSERIVVDGVPISAVEINELVEQLRPVVDEMKNDARLGHPTFFETVTAMAFQHFAHHKVDFGVVEVGMGGRYDSTNVVRPCITVITNVNMEHLDYLGDTLEKIAFEKAGIIKPAVDVISAALQPEVREIIDSRAGECGSRVYYLSRDFRHSSKPEAFPHQSLEFSSPWNTWEDIEIRLPGGFQAENAAVAIMGLEILHRKDLISLNEAAMRRGLAQARWPARLEKLADSPLLLLDSAHNPSAMSSSADAVKQLFPNRRIILVVGMLSDKDVVESLRALRTLGNELIVTQPKYKRALMASQLADAAHAIFDNVKCEQSIASALKHALSLAERKDIILITGSLFNVAEVREFMSQYSPVRG